MARIIHPATATRKVEKLTILKYSIRILLVFVPIWAVAAARPAAITALQVVGRGEDHAGPFHVIVFRFKRRLRPGLGFVSIHCSIVADASGWRPGKIEP